MKVNCLRESMLAAFHVCATVAPSRSPKPILQNVRLDATASGAIMMATDLEVGIRIDVDGVETVQPGSAVLPVERFGLILRESSDEKLYIESDAQGTVIRGTHSEFRLPGGNPDEFPVVAQFSEERFHELPAKLLRELIRRTIFATDTESTRYALGGVLFEFTKDRITAVGTDGRRLAKMEGPGQAVNGHSSGDTMTIVPTRSLTLIERALTEPDSQVHITARPNDVLIKSDRVTIYSRLVEGRFPKWRDVLPKREKAIRMDMTVGPMYSAHRQASVVTDKESRGIDFTFGEGTLVLSGLTAEVGQSRVEMPISYNGTPIKVTLDNRFVADFFRVLEPDRVFTLEIETPETAALFLTDDGYAYVVMPLSRER